MIEAKFNFIPENQLKELSNGNDLWISISTSGQLYFNREVIQHYELKDKYFKLYADETKRAIGWKLFKEGELGDLKGLRKLSYYEKVGKGTIMVTKILAKIDKDWKKKKFTRLPIKEYTSPLFEGKMYYIELKTQK